MSIALNALCKAAGVIWRYQDGAGTRRTAPTASRRAILKAMGLEAETEAHATEQLEELLSAVASRDLPPWVVVEAHCRLELPVRTACEWRLTLEDGAMIEGRGTNSINLEALPVGVHRLKTPNSVTTLLSAPATLPLPPRTWGVMLPLYGLKPGGLGDYADLAVAAGALAAQGAGFLGINPVHAGFPEDPVAYSPYSPSHRRRLNIAHIPTSGTDPAPNCLVDYPAEILAKKAALKRAFESATSDPASDRFFEQEGEALHCFAIHQALSESFGPYWNKWPKPYHNPSSAEVNRFAAQNADAVRFHAWLQFTAERHMGEAAQAASGMALGLYLDLAVGTHPEGAETWAEPASFAKGISLGAPPDAFSPSGQSWGLAPILPRRLAAQAFRPLSETLAKQLAFAGLLRIDHALGFDRAFWVPDGLPGAYVKMPRDAMLAVARIEARRAGTTIIGEDLGNVPRGLRAAMARSGLLGSRVAMFERDWKGDRSFTTAENYPTRAIASFNTHDLPTWSGWRSGRDIAWREKLGETDPEEAPQMRAERRDDVGAFDDLTGGNTADDLFQFLGRTKSRLVALQIEDILGLEEQPNLPGTIAEHPNWRRRLPIGAAELAGEKCIARIAETMSKHGR